MSISELKYENWPKVRTVKTPDGSTVKLWGRQIHCWDGPAVITENGSKEYYLYGIKYSLDDFKSAVRDRTGLPWYKNPSLKGTQRH